MSVVYEPPSLWYFIMNMTKSYGYKMTQLEFKLSSASLASTGSLLSTLAPKATWKLPFISRKLEPMSVAE